MSSPYPNKGQLFKEIGLFILITALLMAVSDLLLLKYSVYPPYAVTLRMWSVGISAIIALTILKKPLAGLGWKWGKAKYHGIALLLPCLYAGAAYFLADITGLTTLGSDANTEAFVAKAGFDELGTAGLLFSILFLLIGAMPGNYITALGEEIGWRGFLTPRINGALGFVAGTLITGLIWGMWHLPLVIIGGYNAGGALLFEISAFMLLVVSISGILAWLRTTSGSLWPAATLHAAHNLIIQKIFDPLTTSEASHITIVGEFGILLAIIAFLASIPFWIMGYRSWKREHRQH